MKSRTIHLNRYLATDSLKMFILRRLKLLGRAGDAVAEFSGRLKSHIDGSQNLEIVFRVDRAKIEKEMRFHISMAVRPGMPIPESCRFGDPLNRWFPESDSRPEEEVASENARVEELVQEELSSLKNFLSELRLLGGGKIVVDVQ